MEPAPPRTSTDEQSKPLRDTSRASSYGSIVQPAQPVPNKQPLARHGLLSAKSKSADAESLSTTLSNVSIDNSARSSPSQRYSRESISHRNHDRRESDGSISSWSDAASGFPDAGPVRLPTAPTSVEIYDSLEREQEAIVNKLQREISVLKGDKARSRSRSTSSTSSISRRPSTRSIYSSSDTEDVHPSGTLLIPPSQLVAQRSTRASFGSGNSDDPYLATLKRENDTLKKLVTDLSQKLTEKEKEVEVLRNKLEQST